MAAIQGTSREVSSDPVTPRERRAGMILPDMSQEQRLFHYTYAGRNEKVLFMNFRLLQQLNIVELQNGLAKCNAKILNEMSASQADVVALRATIHEYATAIRDYDYLQNLRDSSLDEAKEHRDDLTYAFENIAEEFNVDFNANYKVLHEDELDNIDPLRDSLRRLLPLSLSYSKADKSRQVDEYYIDKKLPNRISPFVDRLARFIIAFTSGAFFIVPMVIMSLNKTLAKSLVTTSIAVLLFSGCMSFGIRAQNWEIVAAVAAYAAVLVVFVGIST